MQSLAILHYHLRPGGVTRVIANHLRALDATAEETLQVILLYDGDRSGWPETLEPALERVRVTHATDPVFGYHGEMTARPGAVAAAVQQALEAAGCNPATTVLQIHNHALGKNPGLTAALARIAEGGWRLLLQCHDFAEDFRPVEFAHLRSDLPHEQWYPQADHIHYATLNSRDRNLLAAAGVATERLHLLPNPVLEDPPGDRDAGRAALAAAYGPAWRQRYLLYPVRGIARKQLGELLLHAALADDDTAYGLSLAPENPWQRAPYQRWVDLAHERKLPVLFESGQVAGLSFADHIAAADHIITTSIAEGFGMAFLESCLSGHLILGRDLPEITVDFRAAGARFPGLYPHLPIPLTWIDRDAWRQALLASYGQVLDAYRRPRPTIGALGAISNDLISDGCVDFATCTTAVQEEIIALVCDDPDRKIELGARIRPPLATLDTPERQALITANRQAVQTAYGMPAIGRHLRDCCHQVLASDTAPVAPLPGADDLLAGFLDLGRFTPVRILPE